MENWTRHLVEQQDGRQDWLALKRHYAGEGNTLRRIAEAEKLKNSLSYRHEKVMSFADFLDSFQRMCTIYQEEDEELSDQAKVRELLKMTSQAPALSSAVSALRIQHNLNNLTYTQAANHLQSLISQNNAANQAIRQLSSYEASYWGQGRGGRFWHGRGWFRGCG